MRTVAGLLAVAGALATQLEHAIVVGALMPFVATLLAAHVDRESGQISLRLLQGGSMLLPRSRRAAHLDEWIDHVLTAGEHGVNPLFRALSIVLLAAPCLAVGLRVGARRSA